MKKKIAVMLAVPVLLTAVIGILLHLQNRPSRISREQFESIHVGMTMDDVHQILGGPPRNEASNPIIAWRPHNDTLKSITIEPGLTDVSFFRATSDDSRGSESVWVGNTALIAASFGADGRLTDKYFSTVSNPGGPPLANWIGRRADVK